ncbi:MAG: hypothetical protein ACM3Q2_17890 [Syntrophothermus sp.]
MKNFRLTAQYVTSGHGMEMLRQQQHAAEKDAGVIFLEFSVIIFYKDN